jgi:hypothetical protein
MHHPNIQRLIDYWTSRARPGEAPSRGAIDPGDFPQLAGQALVLGRERRGAYSIRLAGGMVRELHQRDLRGAEALSLWAAHDRPRLQAALEEVRTWPQPLVVLAEAMTDGPSLSLEILFAPLAPHDGGPERCLGLYQPLASPSRLGGRAVIEMAVRGLRRRGAANEETAPAPVAALRRA